MCFVVVVGVVDVVVVGCLLDRYLALQSVASSSQLRDNQPTHSESHVFASSAFAVVQ